MSAHHLLNAGDISHPDDGLFDLLERAREADRAAEPEPVIPGLRVIDAHRSTIERAGAILMRRYKLGPLRAFALLVRWARLSHTPVHVVAEMLVHGQGEADPWTATRHRLLNRWLEDQLLKAAPSSTYAPHRVNRTRQPPVP